MNMKAIKKSEVNIFGEKSNAEIIKVGFFSYGVKRICDGAILAKSAKFRKYRNDIIRTMYTGFSFGSGDFILEADTVNGLKVIYKWT